MTQYTIQNKDNDWQRIKTHLDSLLTQQRSISKNCQYIETEEVDRQLGVSKMSYTYIFSGDVKFQE